MIDDFLIAFRKAEYNDEKTFSEFIVLYHNTLASLRPDLFKQVPDSDVFKILFKQIIHNENLFLYFVCFDNKPVGYFLAEKKSKDENMFCFKQNIFYIEQFFLMKKYRNKGIAKRMALKMKELATELKTDYLEAEILSNNKPSLSLMRLLNVSEKSVFISYKI